MIQSVSTYWKFTVSLALRFSANTLVKKSESIIFEYLEQRVNSEASANLLAFFITTKLVAHFAPSKGEFSTIHTCSKRFLRIFLQNWLLLWFYPYFPILYMYKYYDTNEKIYRNY